MVVEAMESPVMGLRTPVSSVSSVLTWLTFSLCITGLRLSLQAQ
jgi:hypothetical protein